MISLSHSLSVCRRCDVVVEVFTDCAQTGEYSHTLINDDAIVHGHWNLQHFLMHPMSKVKTVVNNISLNNTSKLEQLKGTTFSKTTKTWQTYVNRGITVFSRGSGERHKKHVFFSRGVINSNFAFPFFGQRIKSPRGVTELKGHSWLLITLKTQNLTS